MKSKARKQRKILLCIVLLLGITVGFALLSTTLQIKGITKIKGNDWNIHWDESSIRFNNEGIATATGPEVNSIVTTDDTVAFEINFDLPGEFFEFTIDMVNEGTVDGIINSISKNIYEKEDYDENGDNATPLDPDDLPLTFEVHYDPEGSNHTSLDTVAYNYLDGPSIGDILYRQYDEYYKPKARHVIRVEYKTDEEAPPTTNTTYMFVFKEVYQQHKVSSRPVDISIDNPTISAGEDAEFQLEFYAKEWDIDVSINGSYDSNISGSSEYQWGEYVYRDINLTLSTPGEYTVNFKGKVNLGGKKVYVDKNFTVTVEE